MKLKWSNQTEAVHTASLNPFAMRLSDNESGQDLSILFLLPSEWLYQPTTLTGTPINVIPGSGSRSHSSWTNNCLPIYLLNEWQLRGNIIAVLLEGLRVRNDWQLISDLSTAAAVRRSPLSSQATPPPPAWMHVEWLGLGWERWWTGTQTVNSERTTCDRPLCSHRYYYE